MTIRTVFGQPPNSLTSAPMGHASKLLGFLPKGWLRGGAMHSRFPLFHLKFPRPKLFNGLIEATPTADRRF